MSLKYKAPETQRTAKNHDPLAHVYLLENINTSEIPQYLEHRIYEEFITDIGERLGEPFRRIFNFTIQDGHLVSDTGIAMNSFLKEGYDAAVTDYKEGTYSAYGVARAEALIRQGEIIERWAMGNELEDIMFYSLCPPDSETPTADAIKQGFKPNRMMASVWRYFKAGDHIVMEAYSLDGMYLEDISIVHKLDIRDVATTTLEQMMRPIMVSEDTDYLISRYDSSLSDRRQDGLSYHQGTDKMKFREEANSAVESHPEVWNLYFETVKALKNSSAQGAFTRELENIVTEQALSFVEKGMIIPDHLRISMGQIYNDALAGEIIDYLRTQAIPHYIKRPVANMSIGGAGAESVSIGKIYSGSCPASATNSASASEKAALNEAFGRNGNVLACVKCPFCGHTVDAKLTNKTISCPRSDCGAVVELGSGKRIDNNHAETKKHSAKSSSNDSGVKTVNDAKSQVEVQANKQAMSDKLNQIIAQISLLRFRLFSDQTDELTKQEIRDELFALGNEKAQLLYEL